MAETTEERRARLVAQAARMRAAQARKREEVHECPPSATDVQLSRLERLLSKHAVGNIAPIPVAMAFEDNKWVVDLHVKIRGVIEYELSSAGESLADAIANAANALSHQYDIRTRSHRDAQTFALSY